jgi:hypothetical protein
VTSDLHVGHPDIHEAGLADGCPACEQIALDPIGHLDEDALLALIQQAVSDDRLAQGRSRNELVASAAILTVLERVGRLASVAPEPVAAYLRDRWRLHAQIERVVGLRLPRGVSRPSPTRRANEVE